jgi:hypothetical protein
MRNRTLLLALILLIALSATACRSTAANKQSPRSPGASSPTATCTIPQNNGGDHDADNNGGPDDGDGCDR